jgi:outer membrane scaffolding protein for murein synthesis (MipA/OmpV family)
VARVERSAGAWWAAWLLPVTATPGLPAAAQTAPETPAEKAPARPWDAAAGFIVGYGPGNPGAQRNTLSLTPGFALRWGRVSFASRSAFSVRGVEAATGGGLRLELAQTGRLRAGLGLRLDGGRSESDSEELRGMGDIPGTVQLRLSVSYRLDDGWRLRAATVFDALGRGNGVQGDFQINRDLSLTPTLSANAGLALGWSNRRHMQRYFGVTPEQSQSSGYPITTSSAGLRDVTLAAGMRQALGRHWTVFGSASATRLLGQAASSPLTRRPQNWGLGVGLVYRF